MSTLAEPEIEAYRARADARGLATFQVAWKESNLSISCQRRLEESALAALTRERLDLEAYVARHPAFLASLEPLEIAPDAPWVARRMARAARAAQVGPMAAVAGALADAVGRQLLRESGEVIVENGGDIFCRVRRPRIVAVDAGSSAFSYRVGLEIRPEMGPLGICTSSGTLGRSLSFGRADAACVLAPSAALADAAATAVGNVVQDKSDIDAGLARAKAISGVIGAVIVVGDRIGAWGAIELVDL